MLQQLNGEVPLRDLLYDRACLQLMQRDGLEPDEVERQMRAAARRLALQRRQDGLHAPLPHASPFPDPARRR